MSEGEKPGEGERTESYAAEGIRSGLPSPGPTLSLGVGGGLAGCQWEETVE